MTNHQSGFTRASSLGPIADFVDGQGGSITRVLQDCDLPFALLENPDMLVPLKEQFRLLKRAARETGDPHFGARLGENVRIKDLSAFGKWVSEADDLGRAIGRSRLGLNTYLQTATVLQLERHEDMAHLSIEFLDAGREGRYQNELLGLGYLIDSVRCFAGRSWNPNRVFTTATSAANVGTLEQLYNANVSTGHRVSAIQFDWRLLKNGNRQYAKVIGSQKLSAVGTDPAVPIGNDGLDAICAVTALALQESYPRIDWVAAKLGMTRRSLQRRLGEQGTTFARMLESLLQERSKTLLVETSEPITEIALRLGYNDTAHFSRAFKRWTGVPPSAYRSANG